MAHGGSGVAGLSSEHLHTSGRRTHSGLAASSGAAPRAGYTLWWKADAITGVADNTGLAAWPDASANHYDLAQATGANQPTYYKTTPAKLLNGLPTVQFNGTTHSMATGVGVANTGAPSTGFGVVQTNATSAFQQILSAAGAFNWLYLSSAYEIDGNTSGIAGGAVTTAWHCLAWQLQPGAGTTILRRDGTQVASGTTISNSTLTNPTLTMSAGSHFLNGAIAEIVLYNNNALSLADIQANEAYLKTKWGTP
jgi:hypothetical protein